MTLATFITALSLAATNTGPPTRTYVMIVANNTSLRPDRPTLRFADDDAARYAELFGLVADNVELYTVLDRDTQQVYPELVGRAVPPRRAAILAGLGRMFAAMRDDVKAGERVLFYFVFSGHGDVNDAGEGFVHLLDGPFTRSDLFDQVIARSPATVNHVIIDACNAYYLVASRGSQAKDAGDYSALIRQLVSRHQLSAYPNTGVVLSTSSAAEVHEWGRIEAGIFSHELRSALTGAADANHDGVVDYDELLAFIAAANGALPDRKTRLSVFAVAPAQNLGEPLFTRPGRGAHIDVPRRFAGRYYLEDDRGLRFADFNKPAETEVDVALVPRPRYYLRSEDTEFLIEPATEGSVAEVELTSARPLTLATRGSAHDAFEHYLFAIPFSPEFVVGYKQAQLTATASPEVLEVLAPASPFGPWKVGTLSAGVTLALTAGVLEAMARSAASDYRATAGSANSLSETRARAETLHTMALVGGGLSMSSLVAAGVLYWLDR